jgi:flagellar protein FlgJ
MVIKSMREAKLADGIFDSDQGKFFQDMYDQQLSVHLSGEQGVGLADVITRQLSKQQGGEESKENEKTELDDYLNNPVRSIPVNRIKHAIDTKKSEPLPDSDLFSGKEVEKMWENSSLKPGKNMPLTSSKQFVSQLHAYAQKAAEELGIEPKVLLAQAALETGWGRSVIKSKDGSSSHNLFNIKAGSQWQGKRTNISSLEFENGIPQKKMSGFRAYESYQDSFDDYVRLLKNNPRYAQALKHAENPQRYMLELQKAGYATDPHYADKVMRIYHGESLSGLGSGQKLAMN